MRATRRPVRIRRLFKRHTPSAKRVRKVWVPVDRPHAYSWLRAAMVVVLLSAGGILLAKPAAAVPGPDLQAMSITPQVTVVTPGISYVATAAVKNGGDMLAATLWMDALVVSIDDAILEPTDLQTGFRPALPPLNPGATYSNPPIPFYIPEGTAPGTYTIFLIADYNNMLVESNETNNVVSTTVTVASPDLAVTGFTAPESMAIKINTYQLDVSITNTGAASTASGFRSEITLSDNATFGDGDDLAVAAFSYQESIAPGVTVELQPSLILPLNATAGNKTLFLQIDDVDSVPESDETNNGASQPVTIIAPDLVPANLIGAPEALAPGETANIGWAVANQGTYGVPGVQVGNSWEDVLRLSADATYDASDHPLRLTGQPLPFEGASYTAAPGSVTIPADTAVGNYFLVLLVDANSEVFEGANAESNNTLAVPITIGNAPVIDPGGPYSVAEGSTVDLSGSASDADGDVLTFAWDLDGDYTFETIGDSATFNAIDLDGPASLPVRLSACDPLNLCRTAETTVQIDNAPPSATFVVDPANVSSGGSFSLALTDGADSSGTDVATGLTYAFDCGAGFGATAPANEANCTVGSSPGLVTVRGRVMDKDGGAAEYLADVTIEPAQSDYSTTVSQPINGDGTSVFTARRGVVPVKFSLTREGAPICELPPATIAITRTSGQVLGSVNESVFSSSSDSGSAFRISDCRYQYNIDARSLGAGTYRVEILIDGIVVGSATFELK